MNAYEKFAHYERRASRKLVRTIVDARRMAAGIATKAPETPETEVTTTDIIMIVVAGVVAVATILAPGHDDAND